MDIATERAVDDANVSAAGLVSAVLAPSSAAALAPTRPARRPTCRPTRTADRRCEPVGTWFDTLPPELVDAAGAQDGRYGLWRCLVRLHLDTLPAGHEVRTDVNTAVWRERYETGWSPRQAAFAAWNAGPTGRRLDGIEPPLPAGPGCPPAGTGMG